MDITKEQLEKEITDKQANIQKLVNRINLNNEAIQQINQQSLMLIQEKFKLEGSVETLNELRERLNGAKPKKEEK
jgi:hypothetical protein